MTKPQRARPLAIWIAARRSVPLVLAILLAACITPAENPNPPVPPLQADPRPLPPVSAVSLAWQPGHWNWNGKRYDWQPGEYVPAEGHGVHWMPGTWEHTDAGWVWRPAHWV